MRFIITLSIAVYFVLLVILVLNLEDKSKIIKYSFVTFMASLIIALFLANEVVMDYIISIIIRYLHYPEFSMILATVIITIVLFLYNIFKESKNAKERIINYIFASFILVAYIIFLEIDVNIYSVNALYEKNSLICLRYITRTFTLWNVIIFMIKYFKYFLGKGNKHD